MSRGGHGVWRPAGPVRHAGLSLPGTRRHAAVRCAPTRLPGGPRPARPPPPPPPPPDPADTPPYVALGPVSPRARSERRESERPLMAITRTALDHDGFRGGIDVRVSLRDDAGSDDSAFDGAW